MEVKVGHFPDILDAGGALTRRAPEVEDVPRVS
jgi:hypothetical protein